MNLIIKGAYYYDRESQTILVPSFTGEFRIVDCDMFAKMEYLKDNYDDEYIAQVKDNPIEFEGEKYYDAECSTETVGDWELLSDLSNLRHFEEYREW